MKAFGLFAAFFFVVGVCSYFFFESDSTESMRAPASVPNNYGALSGCEKQNVLWKHVEDSVYKALPPYNKLGVIELLKMNNQEIKLKGNHYSDFAPVGWKKYIHRRGAIAKVKLVSKGTNYTGIFQGAECGLLRLSLTYRPSGSKPVAPGLAFKVLRDNSPSANISALVSLDGQEHDFNFFEHAMSNIVPRGDDIGQKLVHKIFKKATHYPEELVVSDMASLDAEGKEVKKVISPRQLFFVPNLDLKFSTAEHDVRADFFTIPEGTVIYQIFAVSDKFKDYNYENYKPEEVKEFQKSSIHVADIVTTSKFLASSFSDDGIFFRHQLRP